MTFDPSLRGLAPAISEAMRLWQCAAGQGGLVFFYGPFEGAPAHDGIHFTPADSRGYSVLVGTTETGVILNATIFSNADATPAEVAGQFGVALGFSASDAPSDSLINHQHGVTLSNDDVTTLRALYGAQSTCR